MRSESTTESPTTPQEVSSSAFSGGVTDSSSVFKGFTAFESSSSSSSSEVDDVSPVQNGFDSFSSSSSSGGVDDASPLYKGFTGFSSAFSCGADDAPSVFKGFTGFSSSAGGEFATTTASARTSRPSRDSTTPFAIPRDHGVNSENGNKNGGDGFSFDAAAQSGNKKGGEFSFEATTANFSFDGAATSADARGTPGKNDGNGERGGFASFEAKGFSFGNIGTFSFGSNKSDDASSVIEEENQKFPRKN